MQWLDWLVGLDSAESIEKAEIFLAAPWAQRGAFWLFLGIVCSFSVAFYFYQRIEYRGTKLARWGLAFLRGSLLAMLVVTLADPYLRLTTKQPVLPTMRLLFDGTQSMLTQDATLPNQPATAAAANRRVSRIEAVQSAVRQVSGQLGALDCRIEAYCFDGSTTSRLRELIIEAGDTESSLQTLAEGLTTTGRVTALGTALTDLARSHQRMNLAAIVVISDFAQNSGPSPIVDSVLAEIDSLAAPLYTVGVGAPYLVDLAVELQVESRMKKDEQAEIAVTVTSAGLSGRSTEVSVSAQRINSTADDANGAEPVWIAKRDLQLDDQPVEFSVPFIPSEIGLWEFTADASGIPGESVEINNSMSRRSTAIDDFLRLLYVANEPNWEWRFVKEAFHRDRLVGMQGFRTYLESSDPRVRRDNLYFLETLPTRRETFFSHDIVILDDLPGNALNDEFCDLVEEFVGTMGGGLVVLAGPRFGLRGLADSRLSQLLPVVVDSQSRLRDRGEFVPRLTPQASAFAFMNLGDAETSSPAAWANLGRAPWYQPVAGVHEQSLVLSEHPTDMCRDGTTNQPLIAIRKYGKGEVVYLAFNELWRLRRGEGERFHRRFWSQLIYRLGMSHALGADKRFVVQADRDQYRVDETVTVTVEAYDSNFQPLTLASLPSGGLQARLVSNSIAAGTSTKPISIPLLQDGVFETRIPISLAGVHTVYVEDPITGTDRQVRFHVTDSTAERLNPVRNSRIEQQLAMHTGGRAYDIGELDQLVSDLKLALTPRMERREWTRALWSTPLWFIIGVGLMLSEWLGRRLLHMK